MNNSVASLGPPVGLGAWHTDRSRQSSSFDLSWIRHCHSVITLSDSVVFGPIDVSLGLLVDSSLITK